MSVPWNPPPPPHETVDRLHSEEEEQVVDSIGDTVISVAWVLSVLVRAVDRVSRPTSYGGGDHEQMNKSERGLKEGNNGDISGRKKREGETTGERGGEGEEREEGGGQGEEEEKVEGRAEGERRGKWEGEGEGKGERGGEGGERKAEWKPERRTEGEAEVEELEEGLEEDLCQLWDASMISDVAVFLHQQKAIALLLGVAVRSNAPRLTVRHGDHYCIPSSPLHAAYERNEICIGLLGNMACHGHICRVGFSCRETISSTLQFLCNSDTRILYETTRLILTCVSNEEVRPHWLAEIRRDGSVRQSLMFIMRSSVNEELLRSTAGLLDTLLDRDDELVRLWSDCDMVDCLCDATRQTTTSSLDIASTFVRSLQLLTTVEHGVACLVQRAGRVMTVLLDFIASVMTSESYLEETSYPLCAALSLLTSLKQNSSSDDSLLSATSRAQELLESLSQDIHAECGKKDGGSRDEEALKQITELITSLSQIQSTTTE